MADGVTGTLGGFPILGSSSLQWMLREGVAPAEETFDMTPGHAKLLAFATRPVDLVIKNPGKPPLTIEYLWVLNVLPGENLNIARVRVADRRWMLPYLHLLRRYNMRRNVGFERVGHNTEARLNPVVPQVQYWAWSLKEPKGKPPEAKWQPPDVLENIFEAVDKFDNEAFGNSPGFTITQDIRRTERKLAVENLVLDDSGDACVLRALALFPEAGLYVGVDGKYVIYSRPTGADRGVLPPSGALGPEAVGGGHMIVVDNKIQRPRHIEIRFSMDVEVRFDFIEVSDTGTQATTTKQFEDLGDFRQLDNVLPVPDFTAIIGGETYPQGAWVSLHQMLLSDTWQNPPGVNNGTFGVVRLTKEILEIGALPYVDLWSPLALTGLRNPNVDWASRIAVLQAHWRRTFRISKNWMDNIYSINAFRVGLVSAVNGINAPSEAYCDHSFIGTTRSLFRSVIADRRLSGHLNVAGYPTEGQVQGVSAPAGARPLTETSKPAPAYVSILDKDQGVIHIDFMADPNHVYEAALPGLIVRADNGLLPSDDARDPRNGPVSFDTVVDAAQIVKLSPNWKAAIILTVVPAAPNDERQLYSIKIEPKDIKELLPAGAQAGLDASFGPPWQVRVGPGMNGTRAIIPWVDARAPDIEAIFGVGGGKPNLAGLVLNDQPQAAIGQEAASLPAIARAIAAGIYARFADRVAGQTTGDLTPGLVPVGFIGEVMHMIGTDGRAMTAARAEDQLPEINFRSLLDSSTRAVLDRLPGPVR